jgi:glycosyltransferase involved in cell wall biosynthesis
MNDRKMTPPQGPSPTAEQLQGLLGEEACRRLGIYCLPAELRLSVVMPVYNEAQTVAEAIRRIRQVPIPTEIIVVDDGSTDGTGELLAEIARQGAIRLFRHDRNLGKGAAVRTGFRQAGGTIVIIQDGDLEYDPAEYSRLVQPIVAGVQYRPTARIAGEPSCVRDRYGAAREILGRLQAILSVLLLKG